MSENKVSETKLREQQERAADAQSGRACGHASHLAWKVVGGVALALAATGLIASLHDIRRYIRISTM